MTEPTPVSPPVATTGAPSTADGPISPVSRTNTFPHKTSLAVATQTPLIDTSTPAINAAPVELDGAPASLGDLGTINSNGGGVLSPADEDDIDAEFLGEGENAGREAKEKRAAMLATRSKDPSVIFDVPQGPTAEEIEAAKSSDKTLGGG